jgi:hypothetical protein
LEETTKTGFESSGINVSVEELNRWNEGLLDRDTLETMLAEYEELQARITSRESLTQEEKAALLTELKVKVEDLEVRLGRRASSRAGEHPAASAKGVDAGD